ncbi:class I SAM-dependent methyltransferase [Methanoplanus sp. FWC-SCC4]|uniref:Class I SAM-dependent methyltransferase n=1 Tax=Methanochimaera problematica TaxID=2609417 RepID=A0AA97I4K1_9EURY|nr:class I SAM-dependent methyltransferase [Methanoplanus sp. FWC-SCC4]WOF17021.1 class I SAM-dependent methyltransferase [Methanoplanus sp. FWC-SCC4]
MKIRTSYSNIWKERMLKVFEYDEKYGNRTKWESTEHAREYWDKTKKDQKRITDQIALISPKKTDRILDIGSGPGTIAIPAAKIAKSVVAVEPSKGMCTVLKERAEEEGLSNITVIQKRWEDVLSDELPEDKFDIVVASYSISIADLKTEILRMNSICSGKVFLFWFAGDFTWDDKDFAEFWKTIKSKDFYPGPKADILYGVLYEVQIYPEVTTFPIRVKDVYDSPETASEKICQRHSVTDDNDRKKVLDYLTKKYTGRTEISGFSTRVCMWWDVKN